MDRPLPLGIFLRLIEEELENKEQTNIQEGIFDTYKDTKKKALEAAEVENWNRRNVRRAALKADWVHRGNVDSPQDLDFWVPDIPDRWVDLEDAKREEESPGAGNRARMSKGEECVVLIL